jgi:hypothetical protein
MVIIFVAVVATIQCQSGLFYSVHYEYLKTGQHINSGFFSPDIAQISSFVDFYLELIKKIFHDKKQLFCGQL